MLQCRKDGIRGLAGHLQVKRIRAQVEVAGPLESTGRADGKLLKNTFPLPCTKHPPPSEAAQIHNPGNAVIEAEKYLETIPGFCLGDFHVGRIPGVVRDVEGRATANYCWSEASLG